MVRRMRLALSSRSLVSALPLARGYQPTNDDVVHYNNDITVFLKANVPNLDLNSKTLIMINDDKASSLKGVELKDVKLISVLDASNASILGSSTYKGAIIIKRK